MQPAKLMLAALGIAVPAGAVVVIVRGPTVRADAAGIEREETAEVAVHREAATGLAGPSLRPLERPDGRRVASPAVIAAPAAPSPPPTAEELQALIDDLRDDDERWNATDASRTLRDHTYASPEAFAAVWNALMPCATSSDPQQRDIAVGQLLSYGSGQRPLPPGALPPSEALLDHAIEWLERVPRLESYIWGVAGARTKILFALQHADALESRLFDVVSNPRDRDPFLPAFVLGATGRSKHVHLLAPLLVPHLRDNNRGADACMATEALVGLGAAALPYLEGALADADEQQRLSIEAVRLEILTPTTTPAIAAERAHLNVISDKYDAAAKSWRVRTSYKRGDPSAGF